MSSVCHDDRLDTREARLQPHRDPARHLGEDRQGDEEYRVINLPRLSPEERAQIGDRWSL